MVRHSGEHRMQNQQPGFETTAADAVQIIARKNSQAGGTAGRMVIPGSLESGKEKKTMGTSAHSTRNSGKASPARPWPRKESWLAARAIRLSDPPTASDESSNCDDRPGRQSQQHDRYVIPRTGGSARTDRWRSARGCVPERRFGGRSGLRSWTAMNHGSTMAK